MRRESSRVKDQVTEHKNVEEEGEENSKQQHCKKEKMRKMKK
jgi:hypothetical protein